MNDESCTHCDGPLGDEPVTLTTADREAEYCTVACLISHHEAQLTELGAAVGLDPMDLKPNAARAATRQWLAGYRAARLDAQKWLDGYLTGRASTATPGAYLPNIPRRTAVLKSHN